MLLAYRLFTASFLLVGSLALGAVGCTTEAVPTAGGDGVIAQQTVTQQLAAQGFALDAEQAPMKVRGADPSTGYLYKHVDGRIATLVREDASGAERGAIFDPNTKQLLAELTPWAGTPTLKPSDDDNVSYGCHGFEVDWEWWGYIAWQSSCDGETGQMCETIVTWFDPDGPHTWCHNTSCACVRGS